MAWCLEMSSEIEMASLKEAQMASSKAASREAQTASSKGTLKGA